MQDVLTVPNEVAAELAGVGDGVLDSLRERLGCSISLRGNRLTLAGLDRRPGQDDPPHPRSARAFTASAIARYVLPVPAGPMPKVTVEARMAST